MSWHQQFFDPIVVPGRKPLLTLRDAALYITKLPKAEHDTPGWQAAMQALLLVAEHDGQHPPMPAACCGVKRAEGGHPCRRACGMRRQLSASDPPSTWWPGER